MVGDGSQGSARGAKEAVSDDGKFGQWKGLFPMLKWLLTKRIFCKHQNAKFIKKTGDMSKFSCLDCDGFFFRRNTWRDLD